MHTTREHIVPFSLMVLSFVFGILVSFCLVEQTSHTIELEVLGNIKLSTLYHQQQNQFGSQYFLLWFSGCDSLRGCWCHASTLEQSNGLNSNNNKKQHYSNWIFESIALLWPKNNSRITIKQQALNNCVLLCSFVLTMIYEIAQITNGYFVNSEPPNSIDTHLF